MKWIDRLSSLLEELPSPLAEIDIQELLIEAKRGLVTEIAKEDDASYYEAKAIHDAEQLRYSPRFKNPQSRDDLGITIAHKLCDFLDQRLIRCAQRKGVEESNASRSEQKKCRATISLKFYDEIKGKNPKLTAAAIHPKLKRQWKGLDGAEDLDFPALRTFQDYIKDREKTRE